MIKRLQSFRTKNLLILALLLLVVAVVLVTTLNTIFSADSTSNGTAMAIDGPIQLNAPENNHFAYTFSIDRDSWTLNSVAAPTDMIYCKQVKYGNTFVGGDVSAVSGKTCRYMFAQPLENQNYSFAVYYNNQPGLLKVQEGVMAIYHPPMANATLYATHVIALQAVFTPLSYAANQKIDITPENSLMISKYDDHYYYPRAIGTPVDDFCARNKCEAGQSGVVYPVSLTSFSGNLTVTSAMNYTDGNGKAWILVKEGSLIITETGDSNSVAGQAYLYNSSTKTYSRLAIAPNICQIVTCTKTLISTKTVLAKRTFSVKQNAVKKSLVVDNGYMFVFGKYTFLMVDDGTLSPAK